MFPRNNLTWQKLTDVSRAGTGDSFMRPTFYTFLLVVFFKKKSVVDYEP